MIYHYELSFFKPASLRADCLEIKLEGQEKMTMEQFVFNYHLNRQRIERLEKELEQLKPQLDTDIKLMERTQESVESLEALRDKESEPDDFRRAMDEFTAFVTADNE